MNLSSTRCARSVSVNIPGMAALALLALLPLIADGQAARASAASPDVRSEAVGEPAATHPVKPPGEDSPKGDWLTLVGTVAFFGAPTLIIIALSYFHYRERRMIHQNVSRMIERGMEIPPEMLQRRPNGGGNARAELRLGIIFISIGLGVSAFFLTIAPQAWGMGLIFVFIGSGFLIAGTFVSRKDSPVGFPDGDEPERLRH